MSGKSQFRKEVRSASRRSKWRTKPPRSPLLFLQPYSVERGSVVPPLFVKHDRATAVRHKPCSGLRHLEAAAGGAGPRPPEEQGPILKVKYLLRFHVGFLHRIEPEPPVVPPP